MANIPCQPSSLISPQFWEAEKDSKGLAGVQLRGIAVFQTETVSSNVHTESQLWQLKSLHH